MYVASVRGRIFRQGWREQQGSDSELGGKIHEGKNKKEGKLIQTCVMSVE